MPILLLKSHPQVLEHGFQSLLKKLILLNAAVIQSQKHSHSILLILVNAAEIQSEKHSHSIQPCPNGVNNPQNSSPPSGFNQRCASYAMFGGRQTLRPIHSLVCEFVIALFELVLVPLGHRKLMSQVSMIYQRSHIFIGSYFVRG
jgi:hypothetical protein